MNDLEQTKILSEHDLTTICDTLLALETVVLNVGIPIVPLSQRRAKLKQSYYSPQDDFIKCNLVTVSTAHLCDFLEILETSPSAEPEDVASLHLQLTPPSSFDYIFLPLIVAVTTFSFVLSLILSQTDPSLKSILSAGFSAIGASATSIFTVSRKYRYMTFRTIIENEISRREGNIGTFNTRKIPLTSLNMNNFKNENI